MVNQMTGGWCLVMAGVVLLIFGGRLELVSLLVPLSLLLAILLLTGCDKKTRLPGGIKKA
jgi:hypothetical protein